MTRKRKLDQQSGCVTFFYCQAFSDGVGRNVGLCHFFLLEGIPWKGPKKLSRLQKKNDVKRSLDKGGGWVVSFLFVEVPSASLDSTDVMPLFLSTRTPLKTHHYAEVRVKTYHIRTFLFLCLFCCCCSLLVQRGCTGSSRGATIYSHFKHDHDLSCFRL